MITNEEKKEIERYYRRRYERFFKELVSVVADVVKRNDRVALLFLVNTTNTLYNAAIDRLAPSEEDAPVVSTMN